MSFLTEINCTTILEAIKNEKSKERNEIEQESGEYVNISPRVNTFWTDLFANCFLCCDIGESEAGKTNTLTHDDMLFFVKLMNVEAEKNKIEVYRRDSKLLPCLTDLNYDWEETVYLNLILHEFSYTLTCAICVQKGNKDLEILKRHSKRVYANASKRDLSSKGTEEIITYPHIYFMVDDFDDAFNEMIVNENEMVCVELIANDGRFRKVLFLGSIKYESLKKVYDARASTSSKLVQKMSMGTFSEKRVEFVKMKGPAGKGYAEMAVSHHQKTPQTPSLMTPVYEQMNFDPFQNILKFPSMLRKKSVNVASPVVTPDVDRLPSFQQDESIWNRTFGQALSWLNKPGSSVQENINIDNYSDNYGRETTTTSISITSKSSPQSIPLNAYLTYVTLNLQLIIKDVLETRQKSLLTG